MEIKEWVLENMEWLFGGLGVAVIGWLISRRVAHRTQKQKGGHGSTNIQVGKNINLDGRQDDD